MNHNHYTRAVRSRSVTASGLNPKLTPAAKYGPEMRPDRKGGRKDGLSRFAWYRYATRPTDAYLSGLVDELLPGERAAFIPGVMDVLRSYARQLLRRRRSAAQAGAAERSA